VSEPVRLTVVPNEGEAEIVCGLLRAEGIVCAHRYTNVSSGSADASTTFGGWREVVVLEADLERARELIESQGDPGSAETTSGG
jgi:Putative prokaryotic signal transducing protein